MVEQQSGTRHFLKTHLYVFKEAFSRHGSTHRKWYLLDAAIKSFEAHGSEADDLGDDEFSQHNLEQPCSDLLTHINKVIS